MTRRRVLWAIVVLIIVVVGGAFAWTAWARWSAIELPVVGAEPAPEAIDPDAPILINITRVAPPASSTIADMRQVADAVLVVQLLTDVTERHVTEWGSRRTVRPRSPMEAMAGIGRAIDIPTPPTYRTIYSFTVRTAIKGTMRPGDIVRIAREGGRQTFEDDFPRPGIGEQFVVFLTWWPDVGAYRHLYGPATTFLVMNGDIHPMRRYFAAQLGRREDEFVRELAALATQQGG
jgi:hypothetical protein